MVNLLLLGKMVKPPIPFFKLEVFWIVGMDDIHKLRVFLLKLNDILVQAVNNLFVALDFRGEVTP